MYNELEAQCGGESPADKFCLAMIQKRATISCLTNIVSTLTKADITSLCSKEREKKVVPQTATNNLLQSGNAIWERQLPVNPGVLPSQPISQRFCTSNDFMLNNYATLCKSTSIRQE